jgi:hypothetical protein
MPTKRAVPHSREDPPQGITSPQLRSDWSGQNARTPSRSRDVLAARQGRRERPDARALDHVVAHEDSAEPQGCAAHRGSLGGNADTRSDW